MKLRTVLALIQTVLALVRLLAMPMNVAAKPTLDAARRQLPRPPRRPPPNRIPPGGGLDDEAQACASDGIPLTALVPINNPVYTASAHPSFLFYLPDSPEVVDYVEFILLNADEKERIYRTRFNPSQPGFVSVSLPKDTHSLEVGENYHWYLNLHCQNIPDIPSVNGWVQRVERSEADEGPAMILEDSNRTHAGIPKVWYDAIAQTATTLSTANPSRDQALENWQRWLSAIGLEQIAELPLDEHQSNYLFHLQVIPSATN